jgi:hypothetical protein
MLKATTLSIVLCIASLGNLACTYNGGLREDFHQQSASFGGKLPLKVAVVADPTIKTYEFRASGHGFSQNIAVYPGLIKAAAAELAGVFEQVKIVDQPEQVAAEELLVFVRLAARTIQSASFGVHDVYGYRLRQSINDHGRNPVAQHEHSGEIRPSQPLAVGIAAFLTGLTLGALSPITMPIINYSTGEHKRELLEDALHESLQAISYELKNNPRLLTYGGASNKVAQQAVVGIFKPPAVQSDVDTVTTVRPSAKKDAYAIVIGIESYRENLPKADFAAHDAKRMGEYLTKVLGYPEENVVVRLNDKATRTDLEKYVESWLPNRVEKDGSVFIYFSGHGAPNPKTGDAYLVPYDGDPTFADKTGYSLKRLYEYLAKLPAKEIVVVLDSCFSGAGGRSVIAKGMRPLTLSIDNPALASGKTIVLTASAGDQVSSTYDQKGHGLLTYYFLKGLQGEADRNQDGNIDLAELFDYLKPQVERVARREFNNEQTPQLLGSPEMLARGVRLLEGGKK